MLLPFREFFRFLYLALNPTMISRNHVVWYANRTTGQRIPLAWANEHGFNIFCPCDKRHDYWADTCYRCGHDIRQARQKVDDLVRQFESTQAGQQHFYVYSNTRAFQMGDNEEMCSICLNEFRPEDFVHQAPKCGHLFHPSCLKQWIRQSFSCPVCRRNMQECNIRFLPDSNRYI